MVLYRILGLIEVILGSSISGAMTAAKVRGLSRNGFCGGWICSVVMAETGQEYEDEQQL